MSGRYLRSRSQNLLILTHPEAKELIAEVKPERKPKTSQSWQRFIENRELLQRYDVTDRELDKLEQLNLLGTVVSAKAFLAILTVIRDILSNKLSASPGRHWHSSAARSKVRRWQRQLYSKASGLWSRLLEEPCYWRGPPPRLAHGSIIPASI